MSDIEFIDGLSVKSPTEKQPEFIKARLSVNPERLIAWLSNRTEQWINADVLVSKKTGNWYIAVNNWKKEDKNKDEDEDEDEPGKEQKVDPIYNNKEFDDGSFPF